jgi:hypothetical protein
VIRSAIRISATPTDMQPTKAARPLSSGHWFRAICLLMTWIPLTPVPSGAQPELSAEISNGLQLDPGITHSWGPMLSATEVTPEADPAAAGEKRKHPPFPWKITRPPTPDYKGAARDTAYFMVYQLAAIGLLYIAPESVSGWSDEDKDN